MKSEVECLADDLPLAAPRRWRGKNAYSVLALAKDISKEGGQLKPDFAGYSLEFLSYPITGDGPPKGTVAMKALRQNGRWHD